jgi:hypothetical protein
MGRSQRVRHRLLELEVADAKQALALHEDNHCAVESKRDV